MTGVLRRAPAAVLAAGLLLVLEIVMRAANAFDYHRFESGVGPLKVDAMYRDMWRRETVLAEAAKRPGGVLIEGPSSLAFAVDKTALVRQAGIRDRFVCMTPVVGMSPIDLYSDIDRMLRARPSVVFLFIHMRTLDEGYHDVRRRCFFHPLRLPGIWKVIGTKRLWGERATVVAGTLGSLWPAFRQRVILRAWFFQGPARRRPSYPTMANGLLTAPAAPPATPQSPLTFVPETRSAPEKKPEDIPRTPSGDPLVPIWATPRESSITRDQQLFFRLLLARLKEAGIRMVLVDSPVPPLPQYRQIFASPEYRSFLGALAREFDCGLILDQGEYSVELFQDERHLNADGKREYTKRFAAYVREQLAAEAAR